MLYHNPIIKGFNPDPSICMVGKDFYLVTSSFEFFPGVPIYHSQNLVDWELISYCLMDKEQLNLKGARYSGGIYAPTLRYHNGRFYMTTTNVTHRGNFIVYTDDIRGKWSKPQWVKQGGIDPSLLFDKDGKVYFASTTTIDGVAGIFQCEIDPDTGEMLTESRLLTTGVTGKYVEAPHLYHIKDMYYLITAEGGTEYGHMVCAFRSQSPWGPFELCPHNPVLTHRNLISSDGAIQCTGHADILEDYNGNWWLVALGVRQIGQTLLHNLGRETFLSPLTWAEDGWFRVGEKGLLRLEQNAPLPGPVVQQRADGFEDDFTSCGLSLHYSYVRNPHLECYQHNADEGIMTLFGKGIKLTNNCESPTFLGIRQKEFRMMVEAELTVSSNGKAGITAFYNEDYHYEIYIEQTDGGSFVRLNRRIHDLEAVTASVQLSWNPAQVPVCLVIQADSEKYAFGYRAEKGEVVFVGQGAVAGLCAEGTSTTTFTGVFWGMFCETGQARFTRFSAVAMPCNTPESFV